ncbi:hypothetical protein CYMTET_51166 [Cymbomonas tetramitiformis]|uniref:Cyclic nucleotide-binding domain-containing protein n=1 Tax=Cymbomonas tetramitiformis TaxID=36881 RepID=A0AAE0BNL8_9CHLO|nr:hypothetical protein CYMTET_51166 [Cymbomonas tetramitiformis]
MGCGISQEIGAPAHKGTAVSEARQAGKETVPANTSEAPPQTTLRENTLNLDDGKPIKVTDTPDKATLSPKREKQISTDSKMLRRNIRQNSYFQKTQALKIDSEIHRARRHIEIFRAQLEKNDKVLEEDTGTPRDGSPEKGTPGPEGAKPLPKQGLVNKKMKRVYHATRHSIDSFSPVVISLPRGGMYAKTSAGPIQVGLPPETIKDCMSLGLELPRYYVLPKERFDKRAGINIAEFEFPAYFNFFVKRSKVCLIVTEEDEDCIRRVFQETLFGPVDANEFLHEEYTTDEGRARQADLAKELGYFRMNPFKPDEKMEIDTLIDFVHFDSGGVARLTDKKVSIEVHSKYDGYVIKEKSLEIEEDDFREVARVSDIVDLPSHIYNMNECLEDFAVPQFGATFLGTSHGFDANGTTTGFVLWMGGRGIMVDPPPNSGAILHTQGIPARMIDAIILTHCHADHDAGTFQKILQEHRVTVLATETIMSSFLRKYSALCDLDEDLMNSLFNFQPVTQDQPVKIHGGQIRFFYTLHAIPCCAFQAEFGGKKLIYSGDTCYIPERINAMHEKGVINAGRRDQLINFDFTSDVILHEAGVPPLHTPATELAKLPEDVKERLYCVHVGVANFPFDSGLKIASCGTENTVVIPVDQTIETNGVDNSSIEMLDLIGSLDIFRDLPVSKARDIFQSVKHETYGKGADILKIGDAGKKFFIIEKGHVLVRSTSSSGQAVERFYGIGDYFGEISLMTGVQHQSSYSARTDVQCLTLDKLEFMKLIRGTDIQRRIKSIDNSVLEELWNAINSNSVLLRLTESQKTGLQAILKKHEYREGDIIWAKDDVCKFGILVSKGAVEFSDQTVAPFGPGAWIAEVECLLNKYEDMPLAFTLRAKTACTVFRGNKLDIYNYLLYNPGLLMMMTGTFFME